MNYSIFESRKDTVAGLQILLGAALFVAPWLLGFAQDATPAWTAWLTGAAVGLVGILNFADDVTWPAWTNLLIGVWAVLAPWLLHFAAVEAAMWSHLVIGAAVAASSIWELFGGENWTPRVSA